MEAGTNAMCCSFGTGVPTPRSVFGAVFTFAGVGITLVKHVPAVQEVQEVHKDCHSPLSMSE